MAMDESQAWKLINDSRFSQKDSDWLKAIYSINYSTELKLELSSRIGQLEKEGWEIIKMLVAEYGNQPEFFYAAGLCHQKEGRDWLLKNIEINGKFNVEVLKALSIWGASLSNSLLQRILNELNQDIRLAGLDLLSFKSHKIDDTELIKLIEHLFIDIRDPIIIKVIKILQKRDGEETTDLITKIAYTGSDATAKIAIIALGSIGTKYSYTVLSRIQHDLPTQDRCNLAAKQTKHQYRYINNSPL